MSDLADRLCRLGLRATAVHLSYGKLHLRTVPGVPYRVAAAADRQVGGLGVRSILPLGRWIRRGRKQRQECYLRIVNFDRAPYTPIGNRSEGRGCKAKAVAARTTRSKPKAARERVTSATCRSCGACCWSMHEQPRHCDVTPEDLERLPKRFVRLHVIGTHPLNRLAARLDGDHLPDTAIATTWVKQKHGPFKGADALVCAAHRGSLMHDVSCSVYERRPRACREAVQPGDRACRGSGGCSGRQRRLRLDRRQLNRRLSSVLRARRLDLHVLVIGRASVDVPASGVSLLDEHHRAALRAVLRELVDHVPDAAGGAVAHEVPQPDFADRCDQCTARAERRFSFGQAEFMSSVR